MAASDIDGDGFVDLFFTGSVRDGRRPQAGPRGTLYRNRGDGSFEDITDASGIQDTGWAMGAHFADLNGDGRPDLLVTASAGNRLYLNRGGGRFERVPHAGGLEGGAWSVGAAFLDANGDGRLDVYLGNYLRTDYRSEQMFPTFQVRTPADYEALDNALYLQRAGGDFVDATAVSGAAQPGGKTLGACAFDADGDGTGDLFVANDRTPNALLRGLGGGAFEDASAASGIEEIAGLTGLRAGMGIAVGDIDEDGRLDVLVTNFGGEPVTVYHNTGGGIFEDATAPSGLEAGTRPYVQWGIHLEDLDNDGHADVPIVSGHLVPKIMTLMAVLFRKRGTGVYGQGDRSYRQPMLIYRGRGDGTFEDVTAQSGDLARVRISGRGSACADFDGDGLLDLAVTGISGGVRVLRNESRAEGHAVEILPVPGLTRLPAAHGEEQGPGLKDSPPTFSSRGSGRVIEPRASSVGRFAGAGGEARASSVGRFAGAGGEARASSVGRFAGAGGEAHAGENFAGEGGGRREWQSSEAATVIGTRIAVTAAGRRQVREFFVTPSFASGSWLPLHFGLGAARSVERVEVYPPGALRPAAVYTDVPADFLYALGSAGLTQLRSFKRRNSERP